MYVNNYKHGNDANLWSTMKPSYNIFRKKLNTFGLFTKKKFENIIL